MADGNHLQIKNRHIPVMDWPIEMTFGKMGILTAYTVKNLISKTKDGGQQPFWKPINCHNSATVCSMTTKFGVTTNISLVYPINDCLPYTPLQLWTLKNLRWRTAAVINVTNSCISAIVWPITVNFGMIMQISLLKPIADKNFNNSRSRTAAILRKR